MPRHLEEGLEGKVLCRECGTDEGSLRPRSGHLNRERAATEVRGKMQC